MELKLDRERFMANLFDYFGVEDEQGLRQEEISLDSISEDGAEAVAKVADIMINPSDSLIDPEGLRLGLSVYALASDAYNAVVVGLWSGDELDLPTLTSPVIDANKIIANPWDRQGAEPFVEVAEAFVARANQLLPYLARLRA